jgi:hypothetical protein
MQRQCGVAGELVILGHGRGGEGVDPRDVVGDTVLVENSDAGHPPGGRVGPGDGLLVGDQFALGEGAVVEGGDGVTVLPSEIEGAGPHVRGRRRGRGVVGALAVDVEAEVGLAHHAVVGALEVVVVPGQQLGAVVLLLEVVQLRGGEAAGCATSSFLGPRTRS